MKKSTSSMRGIAVETAILLVALFGGAGWFCIKEIKHSIKEIKQEEACKDANAAAAKAKADSDAALALREKAEAALLEEKKVREAEKEKTIETGRTIQRSSIEGAVAVEQLPPSKQRENLVQRFSEIDFASFALYGSPLASETSQWKQTALSALAGQAAAQSALDNQKEEIARLTGELKAVREAHTAAEQKADQAIKVADDAQQKAAVAVERTKTEIGKTWDAMTKGDAAATLAHGLLCVIVAVAGLWILGVLLKIFAFSVPIKGPFANAIHYAANTFHAILAPMSVFAETHAKGEMGKLVDSAGSFISDLRRDMPAEAAKVTAFMDSALSPVNQEKIHQAFLAVEKKLAAMPRLSFSSKPRT